MNNRQGRVPPRQRGGRYAQQGQQGPRRGRGAFTNFGAPQQPVAVSSDNTPPPTTTGWGDDTTVVATPPTTTPVSGDDTTTSDPWAVVVPQTTEPAQVSGTDDNTTPTTTTPPATNTFGSRRGFRRPPPRRQPVRRQRIIKPPAQKQNGYSNYLTANSAVIIQPPLDLLEPIQTLRQKYDKDFSKWLPQIKLLSPFVVPQFFDVAEERLNNICADIAPFEICLKTFKSSPVGVVYIVPETNAQQKELKLLYSKLSNEYNYCIGHISGTSRFLIQERIFSNREQKKENEEEKEEKEEKEEEKEEK